MKSIIITGATRGIGLALARFYAKKGWGVTLNGGHDKDALAAVANELSKQTRVVSCFGSVAEEKTAEAITQKALDAFGHIDLLINNAGISHIGLLSDMTSEEWHHLMGTNLDSVFYMKYESPHQKQESPNLFRLLPLLSPLLFNLTSSTGAKRQKNKKRK